MIERGKPLKRRAFKIHLFAKFSSPALLSFVIGRTVNSLHWILGMSFNEDYSRTRKGNAPQIMAIMRHMALNLFQKESEKGQSITGLRKPCAWNDDILDKILITQKIFVR
jgi:hypothetical protein